jgi:hypothetical protein
VWRLESRERVRERGQKDREGGRRTKRGTQGERGDTRRVHIN